MSSDRKGAVETFRRADGTIYYRARIRLGDGSRDRVDIPDKYASSEQRRALYAAAVQEREDERGELLAKKRARDAEKAKQRDPQRGETCTLYRERLDAHRKELGIRGGDDDAGTWRKWIAKPLGALPIAKVTSDDVERFRDMLDAQIALHTKTAGAEGISAKRAINVWSVLTTTFKAAVQSKRRDLRVRTDNPCNGVLPPESGEAKRKTFVYPAELQAVLGCLRVPLEWREAFAVGAFLYLRPGELHALTWGDVDTAAGVVHITKAYDERTKAIKPPKTANGVRDVPIPATLVALLERMKKGQGAADLVVPIVAGTSESKRAPRFVTALRAAGVTRPRLFENTATTMGVNFRSLRDSGITWLALAGVDVVRMQRRAGHDSVTTTMDYVKQAEDLGGHVGEPFGPLPAALVEGLIGEGDEPRQGPGRRPKYQPKRRGSTSKTTANSVEAAGVETGACVDSTGNDEDSSLSQVSRDAVSARTLVVAGPTLEGEGGTSGEGSARPRDALAATLGAAIAECTAAGDLEGARVAHEALGKLLSSATSPPAAVIRIDARRDRGSVG